MPRKKPISGKQKKEQTQAKRARKRGDEDAPAPTRKNARPPLAPGRSAPSSGLTQRLESRFVALPPGFLERTRDLAFAEALPRPLPPASALFPLDLVTRPAPGLAVPSRPRFRYGQTKKEVEKNEEGVFRKWLAQTRGVVQDWMEDDDERGWPRSPSWFEANLEVWRQLWRVVEASAIVLLLVDARCPPLHCPPSLRAYLRSLRPRRQFVLVLTKADLVDPRALEGWKTWLKEWWTQREEDDEGDKRGARGKGRARDKQDKEVEAEDEDNTQVVAVMSYDVDLMYGEGKRRHRPAIPAASRTTLVDALRLAHKRLLEPPEWAKADPAKLASWRPPVRADVDWDELSAEPDLDPAPRTRRTKAAKEAGARKGAQQQGSGSDGEDDDNATLPTTAEANGSATPLHRDPAAEPLTIGLVGQPNVGKSSLLNALLGTTRVRASKTPGKTKHFQTILWGEKRHIKIVDCPGLVCPSPAPMELQCMAGILPISQIPSLAACTAFVARHMPLEDIFRVPVPEREVNDIESRKTWRGPRPEAKPDADAEEGGEREAMQWTAGEIMEARALDRGFLTAKGGRPDANRAANAMLRTVADGRVRWGFWPPGADEALVSTWGVGVWLGGNPDLEVAKGPASGSESEDDDEEIDENEGDGGEEESDEEDEDEESEEEGEFKAQNQRSFFAALSMEDHDEDEDEDEDEGTDDEE